MKRRPPIFNLRDLLPEISQVKPWTLNSADGFLDPMKLFDTSYEMAPPAALPEPPPVPVERVWLPGPGMTPVPGARLLRRHPAFRWCRSDVREMKIGRSPRSTPYGFQHRLPSLKSARTVRAAATNEFHAMIRAEIDPDVETYVEQPVWLAYPLDGMLKRTKPDVYLAGLNEFWEVKYEADARHEEEEARFDAIGRAFAGLGYGYRVMTEGHLRNSRPAVAAAAIYAARHAPRPSDGTLVRLRRALLARGTMSVAEVTAEFPELTPRMVHGAVRHLFLRAVTLDAPLDMSFRVRAGREYVTWTEGAGER